MPCSALVTLYGPDRCPDALIDVRPCPALGPLIGVRKGAMVAESSLLAGARPCPCTRSAENRVASSRSLVGTR